MNRDIVRLNTVVDRFSKIVFETHLKGAERRCGDRVDSGIHEATSIQEGGAYV